MGENTKIEWTDATWNPVTGCDQRTVERGERSEHDLWLEMHDRLSGADWPKGKVRR